MTIVKCDQKNILKEIDAFAKIEEGNLQSAVETGERTYEDATGNDKTCIHAGAQ